MNDAGGNRTTELREKLTERGVKWRAKEEELELHLEGFYDTRWDANGVRWSYLEINGVASLSPVGRVEIELTPEQAIAATLGSDISAARLAERLCSIADEMRSVGASTMTPHELLACYAHEVDKVADLLKFSTTLGSETCDDFSLPEPDGWYKCPDCGCSVGYTELYGGGWSIMMDDYQIPFNRCPNCGRKVKR